MTKQFQKLVYDVSDFEKTKFEIKKLKNGPVDSGTVVNESRKRIRKFQKFLGLPRMSVKESREIQTAEIFVAKAWLLAMECRERMEVQ